MNLMKKVILDLKGNIKSYLKEAVIVTVVVSLTVAMSIFLNGVEGGNAQNYTDFNVLLMKLVIYVCSILLVFVVIFLLVLYLMRNYRGNNTAEIADRKILSDTAICGLLITAAFYVLIGMLNSPGASPLPPALMLKNVIAYVVINILLLCMRYLINTSKYEVSEARINSEAYTCLKFSVRKQTAFYHVAIIIIGSWVGANVFEGIEDSKLSIALFIIAAMIISAYTILLIKNFVISAINFPGNKTDKKEVTNLNLKNINITEEKFNKLPHFNLIRYPKEDLPVVIFLLDINDLFPYDAEERSMYFEGFDKPYKKGLSEFKFLTDNQAILLFDYNYDYKINTYDLKLRISYKSKERYIGKFIHLVIGLESREGIVLPVQKYVYDYKEYKYKKSIDFSFMTSSKKAKENNRNLVRLKALKNIFWYSENSLGQVDALIKEETMDQRKVVVHSKNLGIGKTTYDIIKTTNQGMIPVVVSAWESNYDHDILYLIFDTMRRQTNTRFLGKDNSLFYMVFFVACLGGLKAFVDLFLPGLVEGFSISKQITVAIIGLFSFVIITKLIWHAISHKFLILKKDNTKVYKDFYIDEIIKMLRKNSNYILLIEDVDRLNPEVINEVFRILSSINSRLPLDFRRFAIISYSEETVTSKLKSIGVDYSDIYNKIASPLKWADGYEPHESMLLTCEKNIRNAMDVIQNIICYENRINTDGCCCKNYCNVPWVLDAVYIEKIKEKILDPNNNLNFRNIVSACEMMNQEIYSSIEMRENQNLKYSSYESICELFDKKLDEEIVDSKSKRFEKKAMLPGKRKSSGR